VTARTCLGFKHSLSRSCVRCHDLGATTDNPPSLRICPPAAGEEAVDNATTTETQVSRTRRMP
jgi:hypothetical protein